MPDEIGDNTLFQYLEWDSNFFGYRIARVLTSRLNEQSAGQIRSWCDSQSIDCLYFLADSDHAETVRLAEQAHFHLVDVRVTLAMKLASWVPSGPVQDYVRCFKEEDLPALRAIARVSHRDSRFYYDENLPHSLCDALYEAWIENSARGYAQAVLVAVVHDEPVGYISCHLASAGRIGLFAVAENAQGQGLGQQLVFAAFRWFLDRKVPEVSVVTQGRNIRGQRLYQKCGFSTRSVQLWYHYWPRPQTLSGT
jgi:dTDP-4-amino-4,6-dideoxy-D-galactose acyltransferase